MASAAKISRFHRDGNDWFCDARLPSDITLVVDGMNFHLHKFPLISKSGRIANIVKESQRTNKETFKVLEEFPGGAETFLMVVKFCYSGQVKFTPRNIVMLYCAADYLGMTGDYDEDNLLPKAGSFFCMHILRYWKDCILALQNCEPVISIADKLQIIDRCLSALSTMACTHPRSLGWPLMMYGSMQSPGGSILWNGIHTGVRICRAGSDWWFEDISCLCIEFFERLIRTMEAKGIIRPENLARAIMYYCKKYIPGLERRQGRQSGIRGKVFSFSMASDSIDRRLLLESVVKLLPEKKGRSFCHFLLGLLRVALIVGVNRLCQDKLERKVGIQLEWATLNSLLIPSYSDSDTLYNIDCVERMIHHFVHSEPIVASISPSSFDFETSPSPSSARLKRVSRLVDYYIAEVASDKNLEPGKIRSLAEALPESARALHDGLYRALDVYLKAHPWLSEKEREQLCSVIDFQKLSVDACAHASQNERMPLRVVLQVMFFEQMQLRSALAASLSVLPAEAPAAAANETGDQIVQRDRWVAVARQNQLLETDMTRMKSKVGELEEEFGKMKQEMNRRPSHVVPEH